MLYVQSAIFLLVQSSIWKDILTGNEIVNLNSVWIAKFYSMHRYLQQHVANEICKKNIHSNISRDSSNLAKG